MDPVILIVIIVAIAVIAYFATRKKPELPASTEAAAPKKIEAAARDAKKDAPAPAKSDAGAKSEATPASPTTDAAASSAAPAHADAAPSTTAEPAEPPPPTKPKAAPSVTVPLAKSSSDDIDALRKGLGATRSGFFGRLKDLFSRKPALDTAALDELEEILLSSDVGVSTSQSLLAKLRQQHESGALTTADALRDALRAEAERILGEGAGALALSAKPTVLLFVGVNGVGKTTTIGKLASRYKEQGKKVLLAAGDTYRAAAVIQLEAWARRVGCDVVKGKDRADPSGVLFDAVQKAVNEGYDVVLCDTAGRLQTKTPLMDELAKIGRSVEKALGRPCDETLLVLDATTGQNAVQQAKQFGETLGLSGIVLTKLDGTAKGGVILGIVDEQKIPVRYVGIGEKVDDLRVFEPHGFVEALFDPRDDG